MVLTVLITPVGLLRSMCWGISATCQSKLFYSTSIAFFELIMLHTFRGIISPKQVVGSESGDIFTTPLHFRNSSTMEVRENHIHRTIMKALSHLMFVPI